MFPLRERTPLREHLARHKNSNLGAERCFSRKLLTEKEIGAKLKQLNSGYSLEPDK
jgi:hypothetical protein